MNYPKWSKETNMPLLMLKLHEEVGEIVHAFLEQDDDKVIAECDDAALILQRLRDVVADSSEGIPDLRQDLVR